MKPSILFPLLFLLSFFSYAQKSYVDVFNSHTFPCDTGSSTIEVNICSGMKAEFADSLLNRLYRKILTGLDKDIADANKRLAKLQKLTVKNKDVESNMKVLKEEINHNKRLKQNIINSEVQWIKLRDANSEVVATNCEGGTGCTAEINSALLEDTLARIRQLESFYYVDE